MAWHDIEGHDAVVEKLRRAVARNRLASSFLFAGPAGIGKRTFALRFAQALLCQARPEAALDPCDTCQSCAMALAGTHPDIEVVSKPEEKAFLPVELFLGDLQHRGREGLCHWIGLKPFLGGRRVAIIDDADYFNDAGANCLLKTLEEPPPRSVLILIGTSPARQLPTIRSRCQLIRFRPLDEGTVARLLVANDLVKDPKEAARLAKFSEGSVQRAVELSDKELWKCRRELFEYLSAESLDSVALAPTIAAFVDAAGKEAPARRARFRQVAGFAADFYRRLVYSRSDLPLPADPESQVPLETAAARFPGDAIVAAACLQRCLDALEQIDRNANQSTLIEAWLDDLAAECMVRALNHRQPGEISQATRSEEMVLQQQPPPVKEARALQREEVAQQRKVFRVQSPCKAIKERASLIGGNSEPLRHAAGANYFPRAMRNVSASRSESRPESCSRAVDTRPSLPELPRSGRTRRRPAPATNHAWEPTPAESGTPTARRRG